MNGIIMTAFAAPASPKPHVTKNIVGYLLIAMLVATAVMYGIQTVPNKNGLLTIFWPLSMFVLANYWLRLHLDEHSYIEESMRDIARPHPFFLGLPIVPAI